MDLLLIGGTMFLGRHIVDHARAAGHRVTTFTRGRTNPGLFDDVEMLHGDRDGGLDALSGRRFDAVIDTCGYVPRVVRQSVELLAGATEHYTFVSTVSVYPSFGEGTVTEETPVGSLDDPNTEEVTGETYGPLKALCEDEARRVFGDAALVIRPGLIVGPFDPSDRFTYWPARVARGGEILAPHGPDKPTEFIDARDLAAWMVRCVERRMSGTFNATSEPLTFGALLDEAISALRSDATVTWVPEDFLLANDVGAWMELPLWIPGEDAHTDVSRAIGEGLTFRAIADTIRDTYTWDAGRPADVPRRAGLAPDKERAVLAAWHEKVGGVPRA